VERHEVIVVGGGPAGSACAGRLHAAGVDVLVLDRARFPRDKPCAGWVVPEVFRLAGLSQLDYGLAATLQVMTGARLGLVGGPEREVDRGAPVSYGIRRAEFDHCLLVRSGARVVLGRDVSRLERGSGEWEVAGAYRAPIVVGAGGTFCPVAHRLNPVRDPGSLVVAEELEVRLGSRQSASCRIDPERPDLHFCRDFRGYGWCFRKGDFLNVGLGRRGHPASLKAHLHAYLDWQVRRGRIPADLPGRFRGHAYTVHGDASRRWEGDGLLLVGDAAGVAAAATGEGIRPALESGLLAAEAILAARGRVGRDDLGAYTASLEERLGPRRPPRPPGPLAGWVARRLFGWDAFVGAVVLDRVFLGRHRPPLVLPARTPLERAA
jgi:geranylgeranyl reductase family protein